MDLDDSEFDAMSGVEFDRTESPMLPQDQDGFLMPVPPFSKPKRMPPRKLPVAPSEVTIWDALCNTQAPISIAQWMKNDRNAMRDVQGWQFLI